MAVPQALMREDFTASAGLARLMLEAMAEAGFDTAALCAAADLVPGQWAEPEDRVPVDALTRLWHEAERRSADPHLGLHIGERAQPRAITVVSYLLMSSPTVREGLEKVIRYRHLMSQAIELSLVEIDGGRAELRFDLSDGDLPHTQHQIEYMGVVVAKFNQWLTGRDFRPVETRFRHPAPADTAEHRRVFGAPVVFGADTNCLVVEAAFLSRPSVHADPQMHRLHEEFAQRHLVTLEDRSVVRRVKDELAGLLECGPRDLESIARRLDMSPRTLQRRLAEEGSTFQDALDAVRRDTCLSQLETSNLPVTELVYLAGFAEPSTFYRAFKRWTGQTPAEYRAKRRG